MGYADLESKPIAMGSRPAEQQQHLIDLFRNHARWLAAMIRKSGGGEITEEIVQETYYRLARFTQPFAPARPRGFLLHIATNILRDENRKRTRRMAPNVNAVVARHYSNGIDADQFESVLLRQVVTSLPPVCRDVFILNRFGGMSYAEIAVLRKLSVKTVERRMSQALALCAASLRA